MKCVGGIRFIACLCFMLAGTPARARHYVSHRSSSYAGTATTPVTLLTLPTFCKSQELCSPPSLTFSPPPVELGRHVI